MNKQGQEIKELMFEGYPKSFEMNTIVYHKWDYCDPNMNLQHKIKVILELFQLYAAAVNVEGWGKLLLFKLQ